jgi:hypothetical protein
MTHQIKHVRRSKYGTPFEAGRRVQVKTIDNQVVRGKSLGVKLGFWDHKRKPEPTLSIENRKTITAIPLRNIIIKNNIKFKVIKGGFLESDSYLTKTKSEALQLQKELNDRAESYDYYVEKTEGGWLVSEP